MSAWDSASRLAFAAACVLSVSAPVAIAQSSRTPAPIIYKTPDAPQTSAPVQQRAGQVAPSTPTISAPTASVPMSTDRPRIEFRHPGQPSPVSTGGQETEPARQYARLETPQPAPSQSTRTPAATGGFDPRATAAAIEAQRQPATAAGAGADRPAADTYSLPGTVHQPAQVASYDETGLASVYGEGFQGQPTANGEIYDETKLTAAHPSLPLPSLVQVINLDTGKEVVVRVNDRGPFQEGRMIDLSAQAAQALALTDTSRTQVRVRYLGPASVDSTPQELRWVAGTAETPSRPVAEFELGQLSDTVAPAPQPTVSTQPPVLQPTPRPAAANTGGYYVQVGAFSQIGNAERMSRSMDAGLNVKVIPARVNNADYFRVWVGPYTSEAQADRVRSDMARRGVANGVVVSGR